MELYLSCIFGGEGLEDMLVQNCMTFVDLGEKKKRLPF